MPLIRESTPTHSVACRGKLGVSTSAVDWYLGAGRHVKRGFGYHSHVGIGVHSLVHQHLEPAGLDDRT